MLREASDSEIEDLRRSHNAIWKWIQRFAPKLFEANKAKKPKVIVLDETSINIGGEIVYLYAAINLESRCILFLRLYPNRLIISMYAFMMEFIKRYGRPKIVYTDGDPWYQQAPKWLRLRHEVISRRIGRFNKYFPCKCGKELEPMYKTGQTYTHTTTTT